VINLLTLSAAGSRANASPLVYFSPRRKIAAEVFIQLLAALALMAAETRVFFAVLSCSLAGPPDDQGTPPGAM